MIKIKLIKEIRDADEIDDFQQRVQAVMSTWDDTPEGKKHKSDLERALASSDDMQELFHKKKKPSEEPAPEQEPGELIGVGTSMDKSVAMKKALSDARSRGHDIDDLQKTGRYREELLQNSETMEYTFQIFKTGV